MPVIGIHRPEREALILERMKSFGFHDVEDVLMHAPASPEKPALPLPATVVMICPFAANETATPGANTAVLEMRMSDYPHHFARGKIGAPQEPVCGTFPKNSD